MVQGEGRKLQTPENALTFISPDQVLAQLLARENWKKKLEETLQ